MTRPEPAAAGGDRIRFDKWLWAARFYKTRSLASAATEAGQARINDERVKPSRTPRLGDLVSIRRGGLTWIVEVMALSDRRGGAPEAALLFRETPESVTQREAIVQEQRAARASAPQSPGRPTKRQRRKLEDFLNEP